MKKLYLIVISFAFSIMMNAQKSFTLDECINLGLQNSVDVRNAELDVQAACLQKQEALAEYFPSVSAMGLAFYSYRPLVDINITDILGKSDMAYQIQERVEQMAAPYGLNTTYRAMQNGYSASLNLTQPVFAGGRIVTGNKLASLGVKASQTKSNLQKRQSREEIRVLFYQVLALQQKQLTLESVSTLLDSLYADVSSAVGAGIAVESDLAAVRIKQNELKAGMNKLDMGLRLAKMNLFNTIGVDYNPYKNLESDLPYIDSLLLEGSFDNLPSPDDVYMDESIIAASLDEVRLLQMQVDAKQLETRMTLGATLPSVMIGANYGYSKMLNSPVDNGIVFAVLQIPISDWGKNSRKIERQRIAVEQARNQRDYLSQQLVLRVRQVYMELCCAYDQMIIASESKGLSDTRLKQMQSSFNAGMCTLTELLQCQSEYSSSCESYIDATLDYLTALGAYEGLK